MEKPQFRMPLPSEEAGNMLVILGKAAQTLERANGKAAVHDQVEEMTKKVFDAESYDQARKAVAEYVNVTNWDEIEETFGE